LDELESIDLGLVEIVVVTVVKFRSDNGGGSFEVDKGADAA
jgi:hypothetical protein